MTLCTCIPLAHPCSFYYLLSPSILFFHILFVLHFFNSIAHLTLYFSFFYLYLYICSCVVLLLFNFYFLLHCPLSGPDLIYISLLIIPCIIYYVTNKETLTLTLYVVLSCWAGIQDTIPVVFTDNYVSKSIFQCIQNCFYVCVHMCLPSYIFISFLNSASFEHYCWFCYIF